MSNYFQTLKRLEREHVRETAGLPRPRLEPVVIPKAVQPTAPSASSKPVTNGDAAKTPAPRVIEQPAVIDERLVGGFSALYDNLCALGNGAPVGTFVIAAASAGEPVERVTSGLAAEIARNDIRVLVAELYRAVGHPMLRVRMTTPVGRSEAVRLPKPIRLELQGGRISDALRNWLEEAHAEHQVVIIQAPPLGTTIDAAMVARACDGLVLAVEAHATPREALRQSVERADTVGCQVLGIVIQGRPEWRPRFLKRIAVMRNLF